MSNNTLYYNRLFSFTFHYVSILICVRCFYDHFVRQIYIPLCLYFNRSVHQSNRYRIRIYIPLCLYFNTTIRKFICTE